MFEKEYAEERTLVIWDRWNLNWVEVGGHISTERI